MISKALRIKPRLWWTRNDQVRGRRATHSHEALDDSASCKTSELDDICFHAAGCSCCLIDFHGTGRICVQLLGLWLVLTGSSCSTLNSPWHLCPNWFLSLFLALSLSLPIVKHQMPQRKAATNSSKCCAALLGISQLNKASLHLCIALYHSLCNYQGDMFEQRAINPIYYTLSSNPRTCAVKPGLSPCFPSPN